MLQPDAPSSVRTNRPHPRLAWIDYAKAFAISLVVFGHASRSIGRTDGLHWSDFLQDIDKLIYSFHIALFFVLAGYTAAMQRGKPLDQQLRGLLWGVVVPYAIWTVIWVQLKVLSPGSVNHPLTPADMWGALWRPVEHMWFLYHLFVARLIWMAIDRWCGQGANTGLGTAVAVLLMGITVATSQGNPELSYWAAILGNAGLFGVGYVLLAPALSWREAPWLKAAVPAMAVLWLAGALQHPVDSSLLGFAVALAGSAMVITATWILPHPAHLPGRIAGFIGEASLAIYVVHPIVIGVVRAVLAKAGLLNETNLLVLGTIMGLALPAITYWLVLQAAARTRRPLARWSGFGSASSSHYLGTLPRAAAH